MGFIDLKKRDKIVNNSYYQSSGKVNFIESMVEYIITYDYSLPHQIKRQLLEILSTFLSTDHLGRVLYILAAHRLTLQPMKRKEMASIKLKNLFWHLIFLFHFNMSCITIKLGRLKKKNFRPSWKNYFLSKITKQPKENEKAKYTSCFCWYSDISSRMKP